MNDDKIKQQKLKKYEKKFNDLMAEMGEDFLTTAELDKLEKKLRKLFAEKGVTFQLSTIKAFDEGARFIIAAMQHDSEIPQMMLVALQTMIKRKESDLDGFIKTVAVTPEGNGSKSQ